jgi:protein involved in polysaccharide export with SLBB domain
MKWVVVVMAMSALVLGGCANKGAQAGGAQQQPPGGDAPAAAATQPVAQAKPNKKNIELNKWLSEVDVVVPPTTYRVEPPDALKIVVPAVKEIDQSAARVRADGRISLNLIGEVYVAGMSPAEISEELVKRLGKFYNTEAMYLSVEVTEFASKKFYVFGQVNRPGVKPYTGRDTVIKVLAESALNDDAWPQKVVLVRPSEDPTVRQKVTIDLKQMYQEGKTDQNYLVEEGDLVYVPPSPLAEFRITFTKLLSPITPVADFALMATTGF